MHSVRRARHDVMIPQKVDCRLTISWKGRGGWQIESIRENVDFRTSTILQKN
jgi:hypothetical protein